MALTINGIKSKVEAATREGLRESRRRGHLGASAIGGRCARQAWYGFRWARDVNFTGRIRRLFDRGHDEEFRVVRWLRMAGAEVQDYEQRLLFNADHEEHNHNVYETIDWDQPIPEWAEDVSQSEQHIKLAATEYGVEPKQWGFTALADHFAGSSDGRLRWPGVLPDGWGLFENKTANDKSFKQMVQKGVLSSKPVHWVQMQIYMHFMDLDWALYCVVNKNDDDIYYEIVYRKPEIAAQYIDLAALIVMAKDAPKRLSNDSSWWECKFCDFRDICHKDHDPERNCRSCRFAEPAADADWNCTKWHSVLPKDFIPQACKDWDGIQ